MKVSTQTEYFRERFSDAEAIKMIKTAGFDAYDFSMFCMGTDEPDEPLNAPDYLEYAKGLRAFADSLGIVCNQAHAPFPSSNGDSNWDEERFSRIVRSMEIASVLGAETIVVHPCQHLPYAENVEKLKEINLAFYKRLIPYCEKFSIKIALENMFQWDKQNDCARHSTCSRVKEFCEYIDMLDSKWIVACLDIGHTALVGENVSEFIERLGSRLQALHVHDNNRHYDLHTLPFLHRIDFEQVTSALNKIGYSGEMTFEADNFFRIFPYELFADAAKFMYKVGRCLADKISG